MAHHSGAIGREALGSAPTPRNSETQPLSGSKIAEDVEEQLRFVRSRGIDRDGAGGDDGHVRCDGPVKGIECGNRWLGYARRSRPERQDLKRSCGYDGRIQNES
jgi:hypothetical protein